MGWGCGWGIGDGRGVGWNSRHVLIAAVDCHGEIGTQWLVIVVVGYGRRDEGW